MISFGRCVCGQEPRPPTRSDQPWAAVAGYGDCVTFLDDDHPEGLAVAPARGTTVAVRLAYPFVGALGVPFWSTFDPRDAARDGYDDYPQDLGGFRLVQARIVSEPVDGPSRRNATASAEILDVVAPAALLSWPPTDHPVSSIARSLRHRPFSVRQGDLIYRNSNFEGDVVLWSLVYRDDAGAHLLAYGENAHHEDQFFAGHRPLTPDEFLAFR